MKTSNFVWGGILIAIVIAIGGLFFPKASQILGVVGTRFPNGISIGTTAATSGSLTVGNTGTAMAKIISTTCNLGTLGASSIDSSHAASTTKSYDCAVTGAVSGDRVIAQLASSTPVGNQGGWMIEASKASTTAGYVSVLLRNNGLAAVPSVTSVGSSTVILIVR